MRKHPGSNSCLAENALLMSGHKGKGNTWVEIKHIYNLLTKYLLKWPVSVYCNRNMQWLCWGIWATDTYDCHIIETDLNKS